MHLGKVIAAGTATLAALLTAAPATADAGLDRFHHQRLTWKSCDDPRLDPLGAQCADVTVPVDYAAPQGRTLTVVISRIPAADPAQRRGVVLSNPGGPGGPGLDAMVDVREAMTDEVRARYDLIGMDPRGVGRSNPVNCHWPRGFALQSAGVDAASYAESVAQQAELAARCVATEGDRIRHITTRNTARDMDVVRAALGEDRISYFGTSYGTYLGAVYTQMFPQRTDRVVLDSSVDPQRYGPVGMVQDMGPANEAAFDRWADWAAARDGEYRFGADRAAIRATVLDLVRRANERPIRLGEFELDDHSVPMVLFVGLDDPRQYEQVANQLRQLLDAAAGAPVEPSPELAAVLGFMLAARPSDNSAQMAIMCGDVDAPHDPSWYWRNIEASRASQPLFGAFADNITPCAFWPGPIESPTTIGNSVPSLIVQATGDTRTTYPGALAMHRALTGSRMVTLQDVPIHSIFGRYPNDCVYAAVNAYFRDGTLPDGDLTCQDEPGRALR
ncbi:alpha/beta hydrolase [Nocardia bhagyanarayanae]|uniref:TAP-like protein n=1 Tax=Nocardia bhagyanarayanae TaxID=1215925 RepID=A0A543F626_9NOCA|nr:alpha/beta hydrolase [Nocardia bhagyanarayanae]TQM29200.1 TAP-like protein [Nocardia bhagyanarayanae]